MSVIVRLLNKLSNERACLIDIQGQIKAAIPTDLAAQEVEQSSKVSKLEAEIKAKAEFIPDSQAHTLVGDSLQMVWSSASFGWDDKKLVSLLARYDVPVAELESCKKQTRKASWSIRERGKK